MTLTLPAFFPKWLVEALAGYWPDCDEDAVRREGDHWAAGGDGCRKLATRHDTASATEKTALNGFSADTKANRNVQLGDDLRNQAEYCDSMAEQCYQKANDCEFIKLQVIGTGIALLTQLAVDAMLSAPGVVKAAEDRAAAEASWAASARRYFGRVKKVGLDCATKRRGLPLAKATAIGAAIGAGTGAAVNAGAQFYQKEVLHHRDKMEWDLVGDAAIIGGVAGGVGARVASRVAPRINKFLGKVAGKSDSNIVRYGAHVTAGVLIGGVGGVAGAVAGAGAGILVTGHIPDAKELRTAVLQGFVGGFVGSATIFARPLPPRVVRSSNRTSSSNSTSTTPPGTTSPGGSGPHPGTTPPGTTPPTTPPGTTPPGTTPPVTPPGTTPPTPPGVTPPPHTPPPRATTPPATPGTPPATPGTTPPATPGTPPTTPGAPPTTPGTTPPPTTGPDGTPRVTPPPHVAPPATPPGATTPPPGASGPHSGGTDPGSGGPTGGKPAKPSTDDPAAPERRPTDDPETPARPPREPDLYDPNRPRRQPEEETPPPDLTEGETDPPETAGAVPSREPYELSEPYVPPEPDSPYSPEPSRGRDGLTEPDGTPPPEHTRGERDPDYPQHPFPPHSWDTAPTGDDHQGAPFAGHPDADVLEDAASSFPEVFDRPRTLEELHQALPPARTFEEVHQTLRPDLSPEEFIQLAPHEMNFSEAHQIIRPDMSFDEFFDIAQPGMTFDDLMAVRDFSYQRNGQEVPDLSRENLEGFLERVWADRHNIHHADHIYASYHRSPEPNVVTDRRAYIREMGEILRTRAVNDQSSYIQGGREYRALTPENAGRVDPAEVAFLHYGRADADVDAVRYRVYVNPHGDAAPALMHGIVHEIVDRPDQFPGVYSAKVGGPRRLSSDGLVIYVNDLQNAHLVVDWLRNYQVHHSDAFRWDVPAMTQQVMEGVSIGAQPANVHVSFGEVRSEAIYDALYSARATDVTYTQFREEVLDRLRGSGVHPEHPHENYTR